MGAESAGYYTIKPILFFPESPVAAATHLGLAAKVGHPSQLGIDLCGTDSPVCALEHRLENLCYMHIENLCYMHIENLCPTIPSPGTRISPPSHNPFGVFMMSRVRRM